MSLKTIILSLSLTVAAMAAETHNAGEKVVQQTISINQSNVRHAYLVSLFRALESAKKMRNAAKVAYYQKLIESVKNN